MKISSLIKILICSFLVFLSISYSAKALPSEIKDDSIRQNKAWSFGVNIGAAFANKYQANFYNGSDNNQNQIRLITGNFYHIQEIKRVLNDTFNVVGMPTNMKYNPAFCVGFYMKKNFSNNFGMFLQFNYSKFTAKDLFTVKIGSTSSSQAFDSTKSYPIWGSEDRINIDIGASGEIPFEEKIFGFLEVGFNLNNTKVRENKISIESLEYSIINVYGDQPFIPNTQLNEYQVHQGGIGLGAFISPGIKFKFSDHIAVDLLGSIYYSKIKLMHYDTFRLHYNVMLRFVFSSEFMKSN